MDYLSSPDFWVAVGQIIMIDILLGGDNAVVIALACRKLPPAQRTKGILWGTAGAIVLRIILIFFALKLLAIPLLKIIGAILLVWIGVKLLVPEDEEGHGSIEGSDRLWGAVKTVIVADFVMSVDNVIAIAGAAEASGTGHGMALVIFGVLVSIPIIVWGSQMVIKLMDRFPIIITLGGMLLGWIAGTMAVTDPALINPDVLPQAPKIIVDDTMRYLAGAAGALLVLAMGKWLARRPSGQTQQAASAMVAPAGRLRRILLAVDGSDASDRAVAQLLAMRSELRDPSTLELHLLNVQPPVPGDVSSFVTKTSLQEYHQERGDAALTRARERLRAAGQPFTEHQRVGQPGAVIADLARNEHCDLVVMGTRGQGQVSGAILGSVAQSAIELGQVPVLLVK
ncbi:MAG: YjbE family putative metal transport protein [Rubrivivax sp.]|nr:YjbE family putative metal transport protein [Rubrivivax sp.]MBK7262819.1 YjbE family putative metal transport protein [Rubrivivax sp.]MBK8528943.1 YjbE family putative metal transport protein [Rubrivivax sp.]